MAKKRTTPAVNPLKQDLVASVVAEPAAPARPRPAPTPVQEEERTTVGEGAGRKTNRKNGRAGRQNRRRRSPQQKKQNTKWTEPDKVQLKARVSDEDAELIRAMVARLGEKTRSNPSEANVARALWSLFMLIEDELDELPVTPLYKPGYADKVRTGIYEDGLAKLILKSLRKLRVIGPDRSGPIDRDRM